MSADEPIHFALLMPFSGSWDTGERFAGAAALAVEKVNADKALLRGRQLKYSWADSGCSPQQGLAAMGELLRRAGRVDAVIGPGCSAACEVTSYLAAGQDLPQISWACAASSLSDKEKYRLVGLPFVVSSQLCRIVWSLRCVTVFGSCALLTNCCKRLVRCSFRELLHRTQKRVQH